MAANALTKINARAKALRKQNPKMEWKTAMKKAGAEFRAGGKAPAKRKVSGAGKKKASVKRSVKVSPAGMVTIKGIKSDGRKVLEKKYGELATKKLVATTKRDRAALQKEMAATAKKIKTLNSL